MEIYRKINFEIKNIFKLNYLYVSSFKFIKLNDFFKPNNLTNELFKRPNYAKQIIPLAYESATSYLPPLLCSH